MLELGILQMGMTQACPRCGFANWYQLENARQQPEIQLVQRAMSETSDHLKILVQRPYLRPYFYENKAWSDGDQASSDEVKAMAELLLDNLASAIIHSAAFPQPDSRGGTDD